MNIVEAIKKGMEKGYKENLYLCNVFSDFQEKVREYLLTVNVAQQLLDCNKNYEYKIHIEYPVIDFYNNAFKVLKNKDDSIFTDYIFRKSHLEYERKLEKIDIAITYEEHQFSTYRSFCGIEIKGINKKTNQITKDAERLAQGMIETDETDKNSIEQSFCAFLIRLDNPKKLFDQKLYKTLKEKHYKKWNEKCYEYNKQFSTLSFIPEIFDIKIKFPKDIQIYDDDYDNLVAETGGICGCIIHIKRR